MNRREPDLPDGEWAVKQAPQRAIGATEKIWAPSSDIGAGCGPSTGTQISERGALAPVASGSGRHRLFRSSWSPRAWRPDLRSIIGGSAQRPATTTRTLTITRISPHRARRSASSRCRCRFAVRWFDASEFRSMMRVTLAWCRRTGTSCAGSGSTELRDRRGRRRVGRGSVRRGCSS